MDIRIKSHCFCTYAAEQESHCLHPIKTCESCHGTGFREEAFSNVISYEVKP